MASMASMASMAVVEKYREGERRCGDDGVVHV